MQHAKRAGSDAHKRPSVPAYDGEVAMDTRPILTFDTSAINELADDGDSRALVGGLGSGFFVRLTFTNMEEVVASSTGERRRKLLDVCGQLLSCGDCIDPPDELLKKLIVRFEEGSGFNWETVDVSVLNAKQVIVGDENFPDALAKEVRETARSYNSMFNRVYADAKPNFDKVLASNPERRPVSVSELVNGFRNGGQYWSIARSLYERLAQHSADDSTVRRFDLECPPFRIVLVALCVALYDRNTRLRGTGPSLQAGRADTFMAVYLPYCDQFVTNDDGQLACYKEVVSVDGLDVTVRFRREFRSSLLLA